MKKNLAQLVFVVLAVFTILPLACKKNKSSLEADFTANQNCGGVIPCTVSFTNNSIGGESFQWDFGDGTYSTSYSPTHVYNNSTIISYQVTLKVTGGGSERVKTKTVTLTANPACETKGTFSCAKKLQSGQTVSDQFSLVNNQYKSYYYFKPTFPSAGLIQFTPVPLGNGRVTIDVLNAANDNSTRLKTAYGNPGETIKFYIGPITTQEYYVRVSYNNNPQPNQIFNLTYTQIMSDSNEINNTFNSATSLPLGVTMQGAILSADDEDYFKVTQTQAGVLDLVLTPVPNFTPVSSLQMNAYTSASSSSKIKSVLNATGETMRLSVGPLDTGTRYFQANAYNNSSESPDQYKITVRFDTSDLNELNNTFATATNAGLNQVKRGTIRSTGDQDFFKIRAVTNTPLKITVPAVPSGLTYLKITVYSDATLSSQIGENIYQEGTAINFTSSYNLIANKDYYIRLMSYYSSDESAQQYVLTIKQ